MINEMLIEQIKNGLEELSRERGDERTFHIFLEAGERDRIAASLYENRTAEEIASNVFGTLYAEPSRLAPIHGVTVLTSTATLEIIAEAAKTPREDGVGTFPEAQYLLRLLTLYGENNNGKTYPLEEDEKSFTVTVNFSPATCGDLVMTSSYFGDVLPIRIAIYLTAVENGVSSNDVKITIDGHPIYCEKAILTRSKIVDAYTFAQEKSTNGTVLQHGFGVDLVAPLFTGDIGNILIKEILEGSHNVVHNVAVQIGETVKTYKCVFGNSSAAIEPGKNVGVTVSLVEAHYRTEGL